MLTMWFTIPESNLETLNIHIIGFAKHIAQKIDVMNMEIEDDGA